MKNVLFTIIFILLMVGDVRANNGDGGYNSSNPFACGVSTSGCNSNGNVGIGTSSQLGVLGLVSGGTQYDFLAPNVTYGGNFSTGELLLTNNLSGQNVLSFYDRSNTGFSAWTARGLDVGGNQSEKMAGGYAEPGTGYASAFGGDYLEYSYYPTVSIASFTAVATTGVMTVSGSVTNTIQGGMMIHGTGIGTQFPTRIQAYGTNGTTGVGGTGTYALTGQTTDFSSTTVTAGQPQALQFVQTGFTGAGTNASITKLKLTEDGHVWFYDNAGGVKMNFDPKSGDLCIKCGADPNSGVDAFDGGLFGNDGFRTTDGPLGALVVADDLSSKTYTQLWVHSGVVGMGMKVTGTTTTRRADFIDKDNSSDIPLSILLNGSGAVAIGSIISSNTKFTASGCSNGTLLGGATAGSFASGTTGTCTVVLTMNGAVGVTAPNGWACRANDLTTPADTITQTATTQTTATVSGTTVSGDVVNFSCIGY